MVQYHLAKAQMQHAFFDKKFTRESFAGSWHSGYTNNFVIS
jgi:hypothetical protein